MAGQTLDLQNIISPHNLASGIYGQFQEWDGYRKTWLDEKEELKAYIYATSTKTTSAGQLPWKNNTTIPKLCQIRDNLHANYIATLFPNDNWLTWEGATQAAEVQDKRKIILSYMKNKTKQGQFQGRISQVILDWIDYGNAFFMPVYYSERASTEEFGEVASFIGPRVERVNPEDITFNPLATSFAKTPKIIRSIKTIGDIFRDIEEIPELKYQKDSLLQLLDTRKRLNGANTPTKKQSLLNNELIKAGFGSLGAYYNTQYVEFLDFYGDWYDVKEQKLHKNRIITLIDGCYIIRNEANPSWIGESPIYHVPWRQRPGNLYGMGPLDNLVGMQYQIDKLHNSKSDILDQFIHPITVRKGYVEDYTYGPGAEVIVGDDGEFRIERPDASALNINLEIKELEAKMEEMAGAPKQAMGFRTPGEKTKFEVQILENAANKIFLNKTAFFEEMGLEPLLNGMLEMSRRLMSANEVTRTQDDINNAILFESITPEDIKVRGVLRPMGARRFAEMANILQDLMNIFNTPFGQNNPHISLLRATQLVEQLLGLERFALFSPNIKIHEDAETQRVMEAEKQLMSEEMNTPFPTAPGVVPQQEQPLG